MARKESVDDAMVTELLMHLDAARGESDNPFVTTVSAAIASQHPDGTWGSSDAPKQQPCYTAQTIMLLHHLGVEIELGAPVPSPELEPAAAVRRAAGRLLELQQTDGSWGEDEWDTCQVVVALWNCGAQNDPRFVRGVDFIRQRVDDDWPDRSSYWFGPGFHGAAMEIFNRIGDPVYADRACAQIWQFFDDTQGYFRSSTTYGDPDMVRYAPAVWQTACAVIGLLSFGTKPPRMVDIDRAIHWLQSQQAKNGCWNPGHNDITCYCTIQAIHALALRNTNLIQPVSDAAKRGTLWFVDQLGNSDGQASLSMKLMGAAAIARTHADKLESRVGLTVLTQLGDALTALTAALAERTGALARSEAAAQARGAESDEAMRLRAQLDSYALKLTSRQILLWGVGFVVLIVVLTFVVTIVRLQ